MKKKIHSSEIRKIRNFLSKSDIKKILIEIHHKIFKNIKSNNKKYHFSYNKFQRDYLESRKNNKWPKIYDSFKNLKTLKKIVVPKISKISKEYSNNKIKILSKGVRIIEKNDKRNYPMHQEFVGVNKKNFFVFWIALHSIPKSFGGLIISRNFKNKPYNHFKNKAGYPILKNQNLWKKKVAEITFKTGDLLILGKYVPHGTAKKTKGLPRWACIVRAAYQ